MKVLVRTWFSTREGIKTVLKTVDLSKDVIERIARWGTEQQRNLLHRKYIDIPVKEMSIKRSEANATLNELWRQIQKEGVNSEDELTAVSFLFGQLQDNPELINLEVTQEFLSELQG